MKGRVMAKIQRDAPILTVSVAAELAGMHPQTVRQYDRLGLVVASRTRGGGRRYSLADVDRLIEIQRMSHDEGINLAGIAHILRLQDQVVQLREKNNQLEKRLARLRELENDMRDQLERKHSLDHRVFAADSNGFVTMAQGVELLRQALRKVNTVSESQDVVVWRPRAVTLFPQDQV